ncbi:hypothetical protein IFO69_09620 [Echinicola sp. CAU 1574]|uniref:Uncharacterized protein n=1 Tax=Echinicola arenosa TaxID=2774144 RepID=A0ABR9AKX0_9BACT|nr:hypothetical protein [Echinicola arenosa]MBD8489002.1 hypothetical protein [Echinicola arenosa]
MEEMELKLTIKSNFKSKGVKSRLNKIKQLCEAFDASILENPITAVPKVDATNFIKIQFQGELEEILIKYRGIKSFCDLNDIGMEQ